jgi:hypothetical protein
MTTLASSVHTSHIERLLLFVVATAIVTASCINGGDKPRPQPADISFEEATQRAFDAVSRPDQVLHLRVRLSGPGGDTVVADTWLDAANRRARSDFDDGIAHLYLDDCDLLSREGSRALGGKLNAGSRDPLLTSALDYLNALEDSDEVFEREIVRNGDDGYRLRTKSVHTGDFAGESESVLYLDAEFLPVREELETSLVLLPRLETEYDTEFVDGSTLDSDFFSILNLPEEDLSHTFGSCEVTE